MSNDVPTDLRYTRSHEWVRVDDEVALPRSGITDHAQELLGDLVFVELPEVGCRAYAGGECAVVESVKARRTSSARDRRGGSRSTRSWPMRRDDQPGCV